MKLSALISIIICVVVLVLGFCLLQDADKKQESVSVNGLSIQKDQSDSESDHEEKTSEDKSVADEHNDQKTEQASPNKKLYPVVKIKSVPIPSTLSVIMGNGDSKTYFTRVKKVHALKKSLTYYEVQSLYSLLNRKDDEDPMRPAHMNALKNDVVNVLRAQEGKPIDLANNLMAMYYDKAHNDVWRDYCVQHLGGFFKKIELSREKKEAVRTLWKATEETNTSIAGTALIALVYNQNDDMIDTSEVAQKALIFCTDSNCSELTKITALQICAKLGESQVLPVARKIASSKQSVLLRMSAIAAVGTLGNESDRDMLEKYSKSSDVRLRKSAQSALTRLGTQG